MEPTLKLSIKKNSHHVTIEQKIKKRTLENEDEEKILENNSIWEKNQPRGILTSSSFSLDPAICSTTIR